MKKILAIAVLLIMAVAAQAQSAKSLYRKYADEKGVSAVYISPAMFRLIGRLPEVELNDEDLDLTPVIKNITGMYILNSERPEVSDRLLGEVERYLDSGEYEMLLEAREDGELTRIFTVGNESVVRSFVIINIEPDEVNFISIEGNIPRQKLEEIVVGGSDGKPAED